MAVVPLEGARTRLPVPAETVTASLIDRLAPSAIRTNPLLPVAVMLPEAPVVIVSKRLALGITPVVSSLAICPAIVANAVEDVSMIARFL